MVVPSFIVCLSFDGSRSTASSSVPATQPLMLTGLSTSLTQLLKASSKGGKGIRARSQGGGPNDVWCQNSRPSGPNKSNSFSEEKTPWCFTQPSAGRSLKMGGLAQKNSFARSAKPPAWPQWRICPQHQALRRTNWAPSLAVSPSNTTVPKKHV